MIGRYHVLLEDIIIIFDSWSCTPLSEIVILGIFPCGLSFRFGNLEFPSCVKTLLN